MEAHAIPTTVGAAGRDERPSLPRLTKVELRKALDTRAGFWLQIAVLGLTVVVVIITLAAGHADDKTFRHMLANALIPASVLLPVIGILLVSSEWSQRTALVSFALVPERPRLIAAKALAGVVIGLAAMVVALVFAVIGTALASPDIPHVWSFPLGLLGQDLVFVTSSMLIGVAFGAALLASAPAIVVYFALPTALGALGSIHSLEGTVEWLNKQPSLEELMSGHEWAQTLVMLLLWIVLPLAIGLWRITRRDLSA
jgi:ABC-2 type transport system permease protein